MTTPRTLRSESAWLPPLRDRALQLPLPRDFVPAVLRVKTPNTRDVLLIGLKSYEGILSVWFRNLGTFDRAVRIELDAAPKQTVADVVALLREG